MKELGNKYGLIAGFVYIIVGLINYMFELQAQGTSIGIVLWIVPFAVTFALVYIAVKELREVDGSLTTGQGVKLGVRIGLIAAILAGVFTIIYTQLIDPEVLVRQLEAAEETWENQGMSEEQIESALGITGMLQSPWLTLPLTIIFLVIGGLIKGAISGSILKQDAPV